MLTRIHFDWVIEESGHILFDVSVVSRQYTLNIMGIVMQAAFVAFFVLNLYIFCSSEHDVYQRMKKWHQHNIDPLSKVEKEQREKQSPQMFRTLNVFFRTANITYFMHIMLTVYSELLYTWSFLSLTLMTTELGDMPGKPILDNLFDPDDLSFETRKTRQLFQFQIVSMFNDYLAAATTYRRAAVFNLFLISMQPLTSASQSARFRAFLHALGQTAKASLGLYLVLFMFSTSVLFYSLHSFGYISIDFKTFSFASMTIFKMMVGRLVGTYYQVALSISASKAMFFTLPIILMKATFMTVFVAVVSF